MSYDKALLDELLQQELSVMMSYARVVSSDVICQSCLIILYARAVSVHAI